MSAIVIAIGTSILMSCNSGNKSTENETAAMDTSMKMDNQQAATNNATVSEEKESHEVDKPGDGPHKGIIEEAGEKNHIEMTMNGKDVAFYLLDDMTNPINAKDWTGKAVFKYKGGNEKSIDLMMMDGALTAMGANSGKPFTSTVTLTMSGQTISAEFNSEGSIGKHEEEHK